MEMIQEAIRLWLLAKQWQAKKQKKSVQNCDWHIKLCNKHKEDNAVQALKLCPQMFMIFDDGRHEGVVALYLNVAWLLQHNTKVQMTDMQKANLHIRKTVITNLGHLAFST